MRLLAVSAGLDERHDDVLRRHERQLLRDPARDDLGVHHEALAHVLERREHDVRGEERLGERDPADRAVVERALEPLHARGAHRALVQRAEVPRERAHALGPHRVPLVRHRGRPDLRALERLLDLLEVREQAQVRRDLVRGRTEARERREHVDVDLARVRLGGDGVRVAEA